MTDMKGERCNGDWVFGQCPVPSRLGSGLVTMSLEFVVPKPLMCTVSAEYRKCRLYTTIRGQQATYLDTNVRRCSPPRAELAFWHHRGLDNDY